MIRITSVAFWAFFSVITSVALYHTSYHVQALEKQLDDTRRQIESERASIHVLKAEWAYLTNPERIESAARRHLAMRPTTSKQMAEAGNLAEVLPMRAVAAAPAAAKQPAALSKSASAKYDNMSALLADLEIAR